MNSGPRLRAQLCHTILADTSNDGESRSKRFISMDFEEGLKIMGPGRAGQMALLLFMHRLERFYLSGIHTIALLKSMVAENGEVNLSTSFRGMIEQEANGTGIPLDELTKLYELAIRELVLELSPNVC